jgi:hypothetical protein
LRNCVETGHASGQRIRLKFAYPNDPRSYET